MKKGKPFKTYGTMPRQLTNKTKMVNLELIKPIEKKLIFHFSNVSYDYDSMIYEVGKLLMRSKNDATIIRKLSKSTNMNP